MDELLDHGPEPEHPWHLEHQCIVQPAPGHGSDLPPWQRAVFPHRATQCHGRSGNGLHGPGLARPALGPGRGGPALYRRPLADSSRQPARRGGRGHRGHVRGHAQWQHQGLLDHLHQPCGQRAESPAGHRRVAGGGTGDHPGCLPRYRDQPLCRHPPARRAVGRSRRGDDQFRAQPHADGQGGRGTG
ncbi:hypothetical protein D9M71_496930 [compost metagenome]